MNINDLWQDNTGFYEYINGYQLINYVWTFYIEYLKELGGKLDNVNTYTPLLSNIYKIENWGTIKIQNGDIVNANGEKYNNILSIPYLYDKYNPTRKYEENIDYTIDINNQTITWTNLPTGLDNDYLYAPVIKKLNNYLDSYFNSGFFNIDLSKHSISIKNYIIKMLWHIVKYGPTKNNINKVIQIMAGSEFIKYPAKIGIVNNKVIADYEPLLLYVIVSDRFYLCDPLANKITLNVDGREILNIGNAIAISDIIKIDNSYYLVKSTDDNAILDRDTGITGSKEIYVYKTIDKNIFYGCQLEWQESYYEMKKQDTLHGEIVKIYSYGNDVEIEEFNITDPAVTNGYYSAYTPLQSKVLVREWQDTPLSDKLGSYEQIYKDNIIMSLYSDEPQKIYGFKSQSSDNKINISDLLSNELGENSAIKIKRVSTHQYPIVKSKKIDGYYHIWINDPGDHDFISGEEIYIVKATASGNPTSGVKTVISEGNYDYLNNQYEFILKENIDEIETFTDLNNAYVRICENIENTLILNNVSGDELTFETDISIQKSELPTIKKAKFMNFGYDIRCDLTNDALKDSDTIKADINSTELYNYIAIYSKNKPIEIHRVIQQYSSTIIIADTLGHDYLVSEDAKIILLKSLPIHQTIDIIFTSQDSYDNIINNYPKLIDKWDKGLKFIPAGYKYTYMIDNKNIPPCPATYSMSFSMSGINLNSVKKTGLKEGNEFKMNGVIVSAQII